MKIKHVKKLKFRRPDGDVIHLDVPENLDQSMISRPKRADYLYFRRSTPFELPQSAVITLSLSNSIAGYLIPGQTILFDGGIAKNNNFFGTYNLLIAMELCERSWRGDYSWASPKHTKATSIDDIFDDRFYYGVIEKSKVDAENEIPCEYLLSFVCNNLFDVDEKLPKQSYDSTNPTKMGNLRLSKNKMLPLRFRVLFDFLIPHTDDSILRFFYVYQAIELLMADYLDEKFEEIKDYLQNQSGMTKTLLRKKISSLSDATKEKSRINAIFNSDNQDVDRLILDFLNSVEEDPEDSFALRIYQTRNIVFHDYTRAHKSAQKVGALADALAFHILKMHQNTN